VEVTGVDFTPDGRPDIRPWLPLITAKCREVLQHYLGYVELDDLVQEVAVWWYEANPESLNAYLADEELSRLRRSIWRVAKRYADRNRAASAGYFPEDQIRYSASEVTALIPLALDPDGIPDGGGVHDLSGIHAHGNLAEGGNVLASLVDVRRVMRHLDQGDLAFLQLVQDLHEDWDRAGELLAIQPDSARRRHDRIVERIVRSLNREEAA
jgi:hypothetical protein